MIYGYARVSSTDQNLDRQLSALNAAKIESIFTDKDEFLKTWDEDKDGRAD